MTTANSDKAGARSNASPAASKNSRARSPEKQPVSSEVSSKIRHMDVVTKATDLTKPRGLPVVKDGSGDPFVNDAHLEDIVEVRKPDDATRILVMCNYDPYNAATVCDHINAFYKHSRHEVFILSNIGEFPKDFSLDPFDVVVVHYSLFIAVDAYMPLTVRKALGQFRGVKALFIQDEYRFVNRTIRGINECGIDVVFTCVPTPEISKVYPPELLPNTTFVNVLTGYIPDGLKLFKVRPFAERPIAVGYRGRVYPAWHGEAGREKHEIGRRFRQDAKAYRLKCDIAWDEDSRLYGLNWVDFIRSCRAMLAVESGASVFDFDGSVSAEVETFVSLLGIGGKQSKKVKRFLTGSGSYEKNPESRELYEELREGFFKEKENLIDLAQISPRVFEAATLRTMLIMYEGSYSGALTPGRHFVSLRKDHSNMREVVDILNDPVESARITARCYAEVCENDRYSYGEFISKFDKIIAELSSIERRSDVVSFTRQEMDGIRKFYYIPYPHSLPPLSKKLSRNPFKLVGELANPKTIGPRVKAIVRRLIPG